MRYAVVTVALLALSCSPTTGRVQDTSPAPTTSPSPSGPPPSIWISRAGAVACGIVRSYVAPTATADGTLVIGSRTYGITAGTPPVSNEYPVVQGSAMCIWGGLGSPQPGTAARAEPLGDTRCGRVRQVSQPTSVAFGELDLLEYWSQGVIGFEVQRTANFGGAMPRDSYRCVVTGIDPTTGDAIATSASTTLADVELHCGVVKSFQPPTTVQPGSITVGSARITLPAGIAYRRDPAGSPTDPTGLGQIVCFNAMLDDGGSVSRYGPHFRLGDSSPSGAIPGGICGRIAAFKAPTAGSDGFVAFSLRSALLRIPAGTPIDEKLACAVLGLDANGDVIVTGVGTPAPVRI